MVWRHLPPYLSSTTRSHLPPICCSALDLLSLLSSFLSFTMYMNLRLTLPNLHRPDAVWFPHLISLDHPLTMWLLEQAIQLVTRMSGRKNHEALPSSSACHVYNVCTLLHVQEKKKNKKETRLTDTKQNAPTGLISLNMSGRYSRSCYLHSYQLQNLQISGRNTLFTDEASQMPLHIHPRNLGSCSTPPAFLMCLRHPLRSLLNNLGVSYHLHPSRST